MSCPETLSCQRRPPTSRARPHRSRHTAHNWWRIRLCCQGGRGGGARIFLCRPLSADAGGARSIWLATVRAVEGDRTGESRAYPSPGHHARWRVPSTGICPLLHPTPDTCPLIALRSEFRVRSGLGGTDVGRPGTGANVQHSACESLVVASSRPTTGRHHVLSPAHMMYRTAVKLVYAAVRAPTPIR